MLFNSWEFWVFFALVLGLYRALPFRGQNLLLLAASYFFYGCWDWRFLAIIFFSTTNDYIVGLALGAAKEARRRKAILLLSVVVNLGLLGFFKYFTFFAGEFNALLVRCGLPSWLPGWQIILPVGISFYTFQSLAYAIEIYRGKLQPQRGFLDFMLYVSFFPQLVAGPIERPQRLIPQVYSPRSPLTAEQVREAACHILTGLWKKVAIGDNMAVLANHVFQRPLGELTAPEVLLGIYAFALQIYGDFSGYSSIAQGVAKLLGFDLMLNFRHPYFATSVQDFWRRWHISLSTWLRDYLYISLGGNRGSRLATYRNLLLTMVLGGFWHGASWTFLIWGAWHGLLLAAHRWWSERSAASPSHAEPSHASSAWGDWARRLATFHLICLGWLFFRAADAGQAFAFLGTLATGSWHFTDAAIFGFGLLVFYGLPLFAYEWWEEKNGGPLVIASRPWPWRAAFYAFLIATLVYFYSEQPSEFIYFQF